MHDLAALADRLAGKGWVVTDLHSAWGTFGSWGLEVEWGETADHYRQALLNHPWKAQPVPQFTTPGPAVFRFTWDGRDSILSVSSCVTPAFGSGPKHWHVDAEERLTDRDAAPMRFVEDWLASRGAS